MTAVRVRYSHALDPEEWARRHARGEVPDELPYGLDRLAGPGITLHVDPPPQGRDALVSRLLRASTRAYEWVGPSGADSVPEVCFAWDERVGIPMALTARDPARVVTGVIWLTDRAPWRGALRALERRALQRCAAVWALSSTQLPILRAGWGVEARRLHHVRFGVDRDFWVPGPDPGRSGRVLVVGNDRHRDFATAVRAVEIAQVSRPDLRVHVVTEQPVDVPPEVGVRTAGMSHVALRQEYQRAEMCVVALQLNAHCSGVTAALEAMACGRPVIVTETPGMGDYVRDGHDGLLVPPGDAQALAAAILRVAANPSLGADLGAAGRRTVEESLNTAKLADQLADLLRAC